MVFVDTNIFIRYLTKDDPEKAAACDLYSNNSADFEDALSVAAMEQRKIAEIYSYDQDFDRIKNVAVRRIEP